MATNSKIILYANWGSSCSWRVRTAMNLKKIQYVIKPIGIKKSLTEGDQRSEDYKRINPMGFVPALQIDGVTIIESMNILYYLEETRPTINLMPKDAIEKTKVRAICDIVVSGIQPLQNLAILPMVGPDKEKQWVEHFITKGLAAIEKLLSNSAGKYCVGNNITLADCCLIPQVYNARHRYGINLDRFPTILKIDDTLASHEAFVAGHPRNQPDAPKNLTHKL